MEVWCSVPFATSAGRRRMMHVVHGRQKDRADQRVWRMSDRLSIFGYRRFFQRRECKRCKILFELKMRIQMLSYYTEEPEVIANPQATVQHKRKKIGAGIQIQVTTSDPVMTKRNAMRYNAMCRVILKCIVHRC